MNPLLSVAQLGAPEGLETDVQGWHSEDPVFASIIKEVQPKSIIEVGTWKGASALHMAKLTGVTTDAMMPLDSTVAGIPIYCVDTWQGGIDHLLNEDAPNANSNFIRFHGYPQIYFQFLHNVLQSPYASRIFPIVNTSLTGARLLREHKISADLIYIDAGHDYESCYMDLCHYWQLLNAGGMMFGDDIKFPSVQHAVARFAYERQLSAQMDGDFWNIKKL